MSTPPQDPAGDAPAPRYDDRTRDIRLPSLPDRPAAAVRPEWQAHVQPSADTPSAPPSAAEQPVPESADAPATTPTVSPEPPTEFAPPRPYALPNEPTDELSSPPRVRQQTLAFDTPAGGPPEPGAPQFSGSPAPGPGSPPFGAAPFGPSSYGVPGRGAPSDGPLAHPAPSYGPPPRGAAPSAERKRRWPWVVLTLLPILIIVGTGLWLLFLLRGA